MFRDELCLATEKGREIIFRGLEAEAKMGQAGQKTQKARTDRKSVSRQREGLDPLLLQVMEVAPRKGDLQKARLIQAAIEAIAKDGIENASYDNIGKELGMRRSHVAYYFKDKDQLLMTVMRYIVGNNQRLAVERLAQASTSRERLLAISSAAFEWARSYPDQVAVYMTFYVSCAVKPEFREYFSEFRTLALDRLVLLIQEDVKVKPSEAIEIANTIRGLILGSIFEYFASGQIRSSADMVKLEGRVAKSLITILSKASAN